MRTKIDKKIASRETTSVRKLNGNGPMGGHPGASPRFQAIHAVYETTWTPADALRGRLSRTIRGLELGDRLDVPREERGGRGAAIR
jgi:hypothetical protein